MSSVKNFRYAIRDGEVWLLDERIPSLTDLKPGSEQREEFPLRHPGRRGVAAG